MQFRGGRQPVRQRARERDVKTRRRDEEGSRGLPEKRSGRKGENEKNFTPKQNIPRAGILFGLDYFYWPVNRASVDTVNLRLRSIITAFS